MLACRLNPALGLPTFSTFQCHRRGRLNNRSLCARSRAPVVVAAARRKKDVIEIDGIAVEKLERRKEKQDGAVLEDEKREERKKDENVDVVVNKVEKKSKKKVEEEEESTLEVDDDGSIEAGVEEVKKKTTRKKKVVEVAPEGHEEPATAVQQTEKSKKLKTKRSTKKVAKPGVEDVPEAMLPESAVAKLGPCFQQHCVRIPVGDRHLVLETGSIGRQASGAVTISDGDTIIYTTVCTAPEASEPSDFIPLYVHYHERFSAAGRTSGGFNKREGKPRDSEVLVSRLVDRPLRPMIPKGYFHEIQVLSWVLSYDGSHLPEPLAITAAGAAMALSDVPFLKPVAGVRVGFIHGEYVLNPTASEMVVSKLDMVLAGSVDGVLMIEGYCDFLTEEQLLKAVEVGQHAVGLICKELESFAATYGQSKRSERVRSPDAELEDQIKRLVGDELLQALHITGKRSRTTAISDLERAVWMKLTEEGVTMSRTRKRIQDANFWVDDDLEVKDGQIDQGDVHIKPVPKSGLAVLYDSADVKFAFKDLTAKMLRTMISKEKLRSDGRGVSDLRPIQSSCGLIPRAHGSAIFTRGETQALVAAILGGDSMGQRVDSITEGDEVKRFYVQYVFPHSCVGEVGRLGPASRREIGHGMLIERALERIFPADFSYTVRVESTITESNGSSSMASVCGGYLALQDAGVPLKCPVAGVAMGLILNPKEYGGSGGPVILSDISGSEDAFGDMDLKVAGSDDGITAFQMDLKVQGITLSILKRALSKAKTARKHILKEMDKCSPPPSAKLSRHVPHVDILKIGRDKVTMVIGSGGKTVKQIIDDSGVETVDVSSDGSIRIMGNDREKINKAKERIRTITTDPVVGQVYRNCLVKSLTSFGCFIEISPGREGLCHVSELTTHRLSRPDDFVSVGERLDVKLIEINSRGQLKLSHRAVLEDEKASKRAKQSSSKPMQPRRRYG